MRRATLAAAAVNVLVVIGGIAYVIGFVVSVMGAGDSIKGPAFQLAASSWLLAWALS